MDTNNKMKREREIRKKTLGLYIIISNSTSGCVVHQPRADIHSQMNTSINVYNYIKLNFCGFSCIKHTLVYTYVADEPQITVDTFSSPQTVLTVMVCIICI